MFVVTGASGNTGTVVAKALLAKGEKVRVVGRSAERLQALVSQGAEPVVADLSDAAALTKAFAGAKAGYLMVPPNLSAPDVRSHQRDVVNALAAAVKSAGVTHAVTLSSFGADKPDRTGPVMGLHYLEEQLNGIDALNVLHLRAGYFMENTLGQIGIIRSMGVAAGPLRPDLKVPMIATRDIGAAAASALLNLNFRQKQVRELLGQRDISMEEVAQVIGKAIGKPDLRYVQPPNEQLRGALMQIGMSADMANVLLEMSAALNSGYMRALEPRSPDNTTQTAFETFVKEEFVPAWEGRSAAA
jgi:uncharacterized protein YbjT (DUF2867 family)